MDCSLGKQEAPNFVSYRSASDRFQPIWNRNFIDLLQIDIPEELGLDRRANFY